MKFKKKIAAVVSALAAALLLTGCASAPTNYDDLEQIFNHDKPNKGDKEDDEGGGGGIVGGGGGLQGGGGGIVGGGGGLLGGGGGLQGGGGGLQGGGGGLQGGGGNVDELPLTIDVNGNVFSVLNSAYCNTDEGSFIVVSSQYDTVYMLIIMASSGNFKANSSYSQNEFGNTMRLGITLVEAASQDTVSVVSQESMSNASFSVSGISNSRINTTISSEFSSAGYYYNVKMTGSVPLSDMNTCQRIINALDSLVSSQGGGGGYQGGYQGGNQGNTTMCAGCYGNGVCRYCKGDRTCHDCLGYVDHCLRCGGSNVCYFCGGTGICHYCEGDGLT